MGPAPLSGGQSVPNQGPNDASGRATVVAVNPAASSSGEFWLGTANGGVWHRRAGQTGWAPLSDYASSLAVGAIAVDQCTATGGCNAVYVGTGENAYRRDTYYGSGVLFLHPPPIVHAELMASAAEAVRVDEHFGEPGPESMFRFGAAQNLLIDPQSPEANRTLYLTMSRGESTNASESTVLSPTPTSGFGVFRLDLGAVGATWTKKTPLPSQVPATAGAVDLEMDPVDTHTLYAVFEQHGIWKTTDRGETWTNFNVGIASDLVSGDLASPRPEIALIREGGAPGPTLYVVLGTRSSTRPDSCLHPFDPKSPFGGCLPSVYRIVDTGSAPQWQDMHVHVNPTDIPCNNPTFDDYSLPLFQYGSYTHALAIMPGTNAQTVLFGGINLWKSVGGTDWSAAAIDNDHIHPDFHQILFPDPTHPNYVLATSDGGLYSSQAAGGNSCADNAWTSENAFLSITGFQSIAVSPQDMSVIAGTQDNGTNFFSGIQTWTHESPGDTAYSIFDLDHPDNQFEVGNLSDALHLLPRNVEANPRPLGSGIDASEERAFYPPMIQAQGSSSSHPIYLGTNRVWKLDMDRKTWAKISCAERGGQPNPPPLLVENKTNVITALAAAATPSTRLYAGFYDGQIWTATLPTDGACDADGWTRIDQNKGLPGRVVTSIAIDPDNEQHIYITFSGFGTDHVFESSNQLANFTAISVGLSVNDPANTIAIEAGPPRILWLGTDHGVFRMRADSAAGGWVQNYVPILVDCPDGMCTPPTLLPNVPVYALAVDEPNHRLYAGTHGRGGWVLSPNPVVSTFEGWVDGNIWDIPTYGSGFQPNQTNCSVSVVQDNGNVCATDTKDAMGATIGTNARGELITSGHSTFNGRPVVWACRQGGCVGNTPIQQCNDSMHRINRVRVECKPLRGGDPIKVDGPIGSCPATIAPSSSGLLLSPNEGVQPLAGAASSIPLAFQVHAVLQVGQGGSDDLCAANVPFSPGEDDGDILSRAADAINADPGCIQAGVKGVFIDGGPEHIGEDEAGGAHFSLSAPTVAGTKLVTSVVAVPGVPSQACFTFDNLGTLATHALLISELTFSALPTGAKGGTVQVTERSMIGQCSVSVPTTAGQSAASIANAVNDALATSSIACPEEQNPQDVTVDADGHSLIFISAQQVVVCLHDDGLGFIFHPKEVDVVNICAAAVDTTPPVFTSVPPSMTISECTSPNIGQATATDSCGVTVTSDAPTSFHVGTTVVTWSAVDPAGNRTTATQTIKVVLGDDPSCCPVGTRVIMGTLGHDVLHGTPGSDCILGLDGADNINGGDGDDFISGGEGADHIVGGQGNDTLFGGDDNDTIEGNDGDDFIDGGGGSNNCSGSAGINTITRCRVSAGCTASCCATQTCSF